MPSRPGNNNAPKPLGLWTEQLEVFYPEVMVQNHYRDVTWSLWRFTSPVPGMFVEQLIYPDIKEYMTTSSNGSIFRFTGFLYGEFSAQWPGMRSFDALFDLRLNQQSRKQMRRWWFETPSRSLWRNFNVKQGSYYWPFLRRIHGRPVNSPHEWPIKQKNFS